MPSVSDLEPDTTISVSDLSVSYHTSYDKIPTLRSTVLRLGRRQRVARTIEALQHVSFSTTRGTVLGIVGANGAGKSTLMRTIAGILPPTSGKVQVRGRVSTLLALGVGFNRNLSGRDNVVLGGLAAGLNRREVAEKYEEIVDFAELEEFMELPMNTYSSGMFSRLAFSVAVHMEPDVLLIDEALSTGDAHFREKSADKMKELVGQARTILLVSHSLGSIRDLCTDAIWMHKGELQMQGEPQAVIDKYTRFLKVRETATTMEDV